jgi:cellulose synthase/poly-beta-1,6-N-acetylglucosamine synthase-like glycosyltransferase
MVIIRLLLNILEFFAFVYLGLAAVYIFFFGFMGIFPRRKIIPSHVVNRKIAVLIPGYKEDQVIVEVAEATLRQDYPADAYDVVIIADSFQPETIESLRKLPVRVVEVVFENSTKSKALNAGMAEIGDGYDIALVLDADNIMATDFLRKINEAFECGFVAVQGHRIAKNMNTPMALLDSVSEEINNHIFRKGHRVVGLSSALIGSGMAFGYAMFRKRMSEIKAIGGFDKELELTMLRDRIRIEYLEDASVMDEKVQKLSAFGNQRRRWLSAQFIYFRRFAWDGVVQFLSRQNIDYLDKVYQMIQPPRILLLGAASIITMIIGILSLVNSVWTSENLALSFVYWLILWIITVVAILVAVPARFYNRRTLIALLTLPKGFWIMFRSLFRLRGANKAFIHTQHGVTGGDLK